MIYIVSGEVLTHLLSYPLGTKTLTDDRLVCDSVGITVRLANMGKLYVCMYLKIFAAPSQPISHLSHMYVLTISLIQTFKLQTEWAYSLR